MWFVDLIIDIVAYPIRWFWDKVEELNNSGNQWKAILLFACSLGGVLLFLRILFKVGKYLVTYHPALLVGIALIIWFYSWVKSRMSARPMAPVTAIPEPEPNLNIQYQKAEHRTELMDTIILSCAEAVAPAMNCHVPSDIKEMYHPDYRYDNDGHFVYHKYHMEKKDFNFITPDETLTEYQKRLQFKADHNTASRKYLVKGFPTERDCFGEALYGIKIHSILDMGQYIHLWVIFDTPEYRNYELQQGNNVIPQISDTLSEAKWDEEDV